MDNLLFYLGLIFLCVAMSVACEFLISYLRSLKNAKPFLILKTCRNAVVKAWNWCWDDEERAEITMCIIGFSSIFLCCTLFNPSASYSEWFSKSTVGGAFLMLTGMALMLISLLFVLWGFFALWYSFFPKRKDLTHMWSDMGVYKDETEA